MYSPLSATTNAARVSLAVIGLCAGLAAGLSGYALAEGSKTYVPLRPPVRSEQGGGVQVQTQTAPVKTQVLNLPKGRSAVIDLPVDASDVFVSNPAIADAVLRTPRRIFVLGVANGQSDAIFFDGMGRQILNLSIRVDAPTDQLSDTIHRLFPEAKVDVQSLNGHVILSGMAQNDGEADQITRLAASFAAKPEDVLNLMTIAGKDQVTLKVRIIEVNRTAIKQLGLSNSITYNNGTRSYSFGNSTSYGTNGSFLGGTGLCYGQNGARTTNYDNSSTISSGTTSSATNTNTSGSDVGNTSSSALSNTTTSATSAVNSDTAVNGGNSATTTTTDTGSSSTTGATGSTTSNTVSNALSTTIGATAATALSSAATTAYKTILGTNSTNCLQAFERVGLVRTLAEPDLTVVSGEAAKFLAGGEYPVPSGMDTDGRVLITFKPYGVGLGFTPVVLSSGLISLKISSEVSELSNTGAYTISGGVTVPALSVRRTETSVEMQSGSSMMIAGLLQSKLKESIDSMPGLTSLPVIGALFRSRDFLSDETEMVVLVTPYIVSPTDPNRMQTPADNLAPADDASAVFMGRLNKVIRAPKAGNAPDQTVASAPYQAPIGYVIE